MDNKRINEYKVKEARHELEFVRKRIINASSAEIESIRDTSRLTRMLDDVDKKLSKTDYIELTDIKDDIANLAIALREKVSKRKKELKKEKYGKGNKLHKATNL